MIRIGNLEPKIIEVIPLNPYKDGTARTIKAQYQQSSMANFKRQDGLGATGVLCVGNYSPSGHNASRIVDKEGLAPTVMENHGTVTAVKLPAETICINSKVDGKQPSLEHRIYNIHGIATACTTSFHPNIAIPQATKQGYIEVEPGGVFDGAYPESTTRRGRVQEGGKVAPILCTSNELCVYEGVKWKGKNFPEGGGLYLGASDRFQRDGLKDMSRCLKSGVSDAGVVQNYRIRKLTPRECFRLMGVSEENIDTIQAAGISNSQQYKMAGNSIVVDVLYYIFKKMFIDKESEKAELTLF